MSFESHGPSVGSYSPWGTIDFVTVRAPGIVAVSTPSHGGIWLSSERREAMPARFRSFRTWGQNGPQWFEEDCDAAIPVLAFPEVFGPEAVAEAERAVNVYSREYFTRNGYEPVQKGGGK